MDESLTMDLEADNKSKKIALLGRGLVIWLTIIAAEIVHGIARGLLLVPSVGEFRSNQIGVFTGSAIIFAIAYIFVRWLGTTKPTELLLVGMLWVGLTFAFEILFGRFVMGLSWGCLLADYNLFTGGLMPVGMIVLGLSPLIGAKLRGIV